MEHTLEENANLKQHKPITFIILEILMILFMVGMFSGIAVEYICIL